MNTKEFIEDLVEDGLDNNAIINFVKDQELKFLELLHTEIGFLSGLLVSVNCGANIEGVLEKRIIDLRNEAK